MQPLLILALGVGFFVIRTFQSAEPGPVVVLSKTETVADTLPDGSDVVLNKQTQLAYKFDQKKKVHTVKLKGEAYFNIQHDSTKTFIVDIDGVMIKDIGTSFNVKAYPESNTVEVVVESGEVMFYTEQRFRCLSASQRQGYLQQNNKDVYNRSAGRECASLQDQVFYFQQLRPCRP